MKSNSLLFISLRKSSEKRTLSFIALYFLFHALTFLHILVSVDAGDKKSFETFFVRPIWFLSIASFMLLQVAVITLATSSITNNLCLLNVTVCANVLQHLQYAVNE